MATKKTTAGKKSSPWAKLIASVLFIVFVCGIIFTVSWGSDGFTNWNTKTWFRNQVETVSGEEGTDEEGTGTEPEQSEINGNVIENSDVIVDGNGNMLMAGVVYSMPSNMIFYSTTSATSAIASVQVRATITPVNADDKRVEWESSDPTIVSVEPSANDSRIATITRLSDLTYGSVTIICRSVDNPDAYAECVIDQLIGGNDVELIGGLVGDVTALTFGETYTVYGQWNNTSPGAGTITGETEIVGWGLNLNSAFMQKIDEKLAENGVTGSSYTISGGNDYSYDIDGATGTLFASPYECFYCGSCDADTFNNAFKLAIKECTTHATLTIIGNYTYGGITYRTSEISIPISFSLEGIWIGVDDVELDQDNIVFT